MTSRRASYWVLGAALLGLLGVFVQAARFQLFPNPKLSRLAERQFETQIWMAPRRGSLLDRNGEPLAINQDVFSLAASPRTLKNRAAISKRLSKNLQLSRKELQSKLKKDRAFVWIKRHLRPEEVKALRKQKLLKGGLWLVQETRRVYPHGRLAAPILGDVNIDNVGIEGVELWKNVELTGTVKRVPATRDALGRPSALDVGLADEVEDGKPMRLTIDAGLQSLIESTLEQHVLSTRSDQGLVAVMDAESGDLLAVAHYPFFDRSDRSTRVYRRSRFFTDTYEPGSVMKPFLVGSALIHGRAPKKKIWAENGKFKVGRVAIHEAHHDEAFGWLSLQELIEVSSNIASAKLALELGPEKLLSGYRFFGFGLPSAIGFPGESTGVLADSSMRPIRLANMGFGQGMTVTAVQSLQAFAQLANGGKFISPRLVVDGADFEVHASRTLPQFMLKEIEAGLLKVTQSGTGKAAVPDGVVVAGKTGTAQVVDPKTRRYSNEHYITSFVGYAPGLERKVAILAQLDHPRSSRYASSTAAPLFRAALEQTLSKLNVPRPRILTQEEHEIWKSTRAAPTRNEEATKVTPDFSGMGIRSVIRALEGFPVQLSVQGEGWVVGQQPAPGQTLSRGTAIHITLAEDGVARQ